MSGASGVAVGYTERFNLLMNAAAFAGAFPALLTADVLVTAALLTIIAVGLFDLSSVASISLDAHERDAAHVVAVLNQILAAELIVNVCHDALL